MKMSGLIFTCLIVVLLIVYFTGIVFPQYYGVPKGAGEFGDMFGAANAIISGLALLLVVCAILLQMNELKLQREELTLTR
ncbi:MAG: hypothetical protein JNL67_19775 [Planctomycetaceae bacterium]|nr:hypothetical protein [Planctomycetaceae bacterium]